ncbi:hypothetical protein CFR73_12335 [Novacetimonas maltaceti]|nr:hypothetical protein [Novacetimonas maltaceti]PYD59365.1 hypothetical protein CFR73_12335 [Novacetimonas maltaceti]
MKLPFRIAACLVCVFMYQSVAVAAEDPNATVQSVQDTQEKQAQPATQNSQDVKLPRWIRKILGEKTKAKGPPEVSNPTPYGETQPTTPLYQTIPGFLQAPYGPPAFGPPFGTTHLEGSKNPLVLRSSV